MLRIVSLFPKMFARCSLNSVWQFIVFMRQFKNKSCCLVLVFFIFNANGLREMLISYAFCQLLMRKQNIFLFFLLKHLLNEIPVSTTFVGFPTTLWLPFCLLVFLSLYFSCNLSIFLLCDSAFVNKQCEREVNNNSPFMFAYICWVESAFSWKLSYQLGYRYSTLAT